LKRAIRLHAKELCPALFAGERSKLIVRPIAEGAVRYGAPENAALEASKKFCDELATLDPKSTSESKGVLKVKTLMFLSPSERDQIGRELATILKEHTDAKTLDKKIKSAASKVQDAKMKDAADIALFGRMVATDHSLTVEGAAMFSHALSTHRADNDIDFYTAVDDRQSEDPTIEEEDRAGSGMMGTLEFTSACYYRYVGLNLGLLEKDSHLGALSQEDRRKVVNSFLQASMLAVPGARKNSMNAHTLPGYVLGLVRDNGQPLQLVNAFEKPIHPRNGLMEASIAALKEHHKNLRETWGIVPVEEVAIPEKHLAGFCEGILKHV
jgi:CRISPR system Cascade subunit CasC